MPEQRERQGTLAGPVAAAARRLRRRGESSSIKIWTGTTGAPATPNLDNHHLPPIPGASPSGAAPNGRTSPPSSRQSSANDRQRFTRTSTRRRPKRPARPPPPSQGQRRAHCWEDHTPQPRHQGSLRPTQALREERGGRPPAAQRPPSHGRHIAATGARRGRPKGGHRNDGDLRSPGVCWPTARRHTLLGAPATGTLHGVGA